MFTFVVHSLIYLIIFSKQSKITECLPSTLDMNKLPTVRVKLTAPPLSQIVEGTDLN